MWRPAAGESPVVYAAFLQKGGRYLRLKLEQPTHSNSGDDFRRVLASVEWPEGAGEVAVPELPGAPAP
jgi:L-alanine-DL-glutamate epimerase-like enolase superfamily enzyme